MRHSVTISVVLLALSLPAAPSGAARPADVQPGVDAVPFAAATDQDARAVQIAQAVDENVRRRQERRRARQGDDPKEEDDSDDGIVDTGETLYDKPVLFPGTGAYYELVNIRNQYPGRFGRKGVTGWHQVKALAEERFHEGRRGRLAVVNSKEISDFLRDTFKPVRPAWIGLRYWCSFKRLQWVTGESIRPGDFENWGRDWNVNGGSPTIPNRVTQCRRTGHDYWPVHYWSVRNGFRWNANGMFKHFRAFFVEYPAPRGDQAEKSE